MTRLPGGEAPATPDAAYGPIATRHRGDGDEAGFAVVEWILVLAFSMVVFVALVNFAVFQYGEGVVRSALDTGVRAASVGRLGPSESVRVCTAEIDTVLDDLLGGPLGEGITRSCAVRDGAVVAHATGSFAGWLWLVPAWDLDVRATATKEVTP